MKRIAILLLTFLSSITTAKSQNSEEWLNQKETQKKYLLQQIVALQVYIGYVGKGYKVVQKGLDVIEKIKNGNFKLHNDFFNALKQINMNISDNGKTKAISIYINSAKQEFAMFLKDSQKDENFTQTEKDYLVHIYKTLAAECDKSFDELSLILSSGNLEMKDDRRLQKLDLLFEDALDKYAFVQSFSKNAKLLTLQRKNEKQGNILMEKIHGL